MILDCQNIITYKKVHPEEVIAVGDVIMIDAESGYVTRAVTESIEDMPINTRLTVGICTYSNNYSSFPIIIDGGKAKDVDRIELSSTSSSEDIIALDGGPSKQNEREIIKVAYTGEQVVNICGFVEIGDKLCISNHAGKAKAIDYIDSYYFKERSIGKVVKKLKDKEQVKVLLDIE